MQDQVQEVEAENLPEKTRQILKQPIEIAVRQDGPRDVQQSLVLIAGTLIRMVARQARKLRGH